MAWIERETGLDRCMRIIKSTKQRESGGQIQIWGREISVRLDRPSKPRDRLLVTSEMELRHSRGIQPDVRIFVARTEAQGFEDMSLCFFGATA